MNKYLSDFHKLNCSKDVLDILRPINNEAKEITEAMGIIRLLKNYVLKKPDEYSIIDLCAGNALASALSAFLLPVKSVYAFDKHKRIRAFDLIDCFDYIKFDIFEDIKSALISKTTAAFSKKIFISIHPCRDLAERVVDIFEIHRYSKALILMPCCIGKMDQYHNMLRSQIKDKDLVWCMYLVRNLDRNKFKIRIIRDKNVMSPKNYIINVERIE